MTDQQRNAMGNQSTENQGDQTEASERDTGTERTGQPGGSTGQGGGMGQTGMGDTSGMGGTTGQGSTYGQGSGTGQSGGTGMGGEAGKIWKGDEDEEPSDTVKNPQEQGTRG